MVPIVWAPEHFMIVVTGDPLRTSSYAFGHNGQLGFPVAKRIELPKRWDALRAASTLQTLEERIR